MGVFGGARRRRAMLHVLTGTVPPATDQLADRFTTPSTRARVIPGDLVNGLFLGSHGTATAKPGDSTDELCNAHGPSARRLMGGVSKVYHFHHLGPLLPHSDSLFQNSSQIKTDFRFY